jgi:hypothetical protein
MTARNKSPPTNLAGSTLPPTSSDAFRSRGPTSVVALSLTAKRTTVSPAGVPSASFSTARKTGGRTSGGAGGMPR